MTEFRVFCHSCLKGYVVKKDNANHVILACTYCGSSNIFASAVYVGP